VVSAVLNPSLRSIAASLEADDGAPRKLHSIVSVVGRRRRRRSSFGAAGILSPRRLSLWVCGRQGVVLRRGWLVERQTASCPAGVLWLPRWTQARAREPHMHAIICDRVSILQQWWTATIRVQSQTKRSPTRRDGVVGLYVV
jgi:hypothetical protein